jgi:hypothetical protein
MIDTTKLHLPYSELPAEARGMLFILAMGTLAAFGARRPDESELTPALEIVWNWNRLRLEDLSDPTRITEVLIEHFALFRSAKGGAQ